MRPPILWHTTAITESHTLANSCSSFRLASSMVDNDWRHILLKILNNSGLCSANTRMHVDIRSTSSSVIGWKQKSKVVTKQNSNCVLWIAIGSYRRYIFIYFFFPLENLREGWTIHWLSLNKLKENLIYNSGLVKFYYKNR